MITLREPEWTSEDAAALRDFFATVTGRRLIENVVFLRPGFAPADSHPHRSFARSRDIAGYEMAVQQLLALTAPVEPEKADPTPQEYPDLDDDSKWPSHLQT